MVKNVADVVLGGITYWMYGYGLQFGEDPGTNWFCGVGKWFLDDTGEDFGDTFANFIFHVNSFEDIYFYFWQLVEQGCRGTV